MERNIHTDEFERFLKDKADQYKVYPADKIWGNINRSIHPRKKWPYIALTLFLLLGTAVFMDYSTYNYILPGKKLLTQNNSLSNQAPSTAQISDKVPRISRSNSSGNKAFDAGNENNGNINKSNKLFASSNDAALILHINSPVTKDNISSDEAYNNDIINSTLSSSKFNISGNKVSAKNKLKAPEAAKEDEPAAIRKIILWGGEAFKKSKLKWQISFSPTVSYRRLTSGLGEVTSVFRGIPYSTGQSSTSVNNLVAHKPAVGAEVGASLVYKLFDNFILKGGLQLNYSRYQLKAYSSKPEIATLALHNNRGGTDSLNLISTMENYDGNGSSWFNNEYLQISLPVGFEWSVIGRNSALKWNIGASAQPVYNFANNVYLLSTDFKHYVQDASLVRKWNLNAGLETFVSYDMGSFKWQAGPQLRYQLFSSYKDQYPIKEHLVDVGFKIGVTKTLR